MGEKKQALLPGGRHRNRPAAKFWISGFLVLGLLLAAVVFYPPAAKPRTHAQHFQDLDPAIQRRVKETYKDLLGAHERKDYARMLEDAHEILNHLDDYNDTNAYAAIARRGLGAL